MTIEELKALDVKELKVIAYDALVSIENTQKSLQVINQLIQEKSQQKVMPKADAIAAGR